MQKFETLTKSKTSNNHLFIFTSTSTYLRFSIALPSPFSHLPVRIAPSFIRLFLICPCGSHRSLFVHCSFIVRSLFVHCSFIVRSLFVHCSSFVRLLFVFCSSFVRLLFVFSLSACRATTARAARTCLPCYDCPCGSHCPSCYDLALFTFYLLPFTLNR